MRCANAGAEPTLPKRSPRCGRRKTISDAAVTGFHAHIYFDADEIDAARDLAQRADARFTLQVGRFHESPVGPHPRGSCQLSLSAEQFARFAAWAPTARAGLTIFAHALTGDDLADHTRHVVWFGPSEALDLSIF